MSRRGEVVEDKPSATPHDPSLAKSGDVDEPG